MKWQYPVVTGLREALRGDAERRLRRDVLGGMFSRYPSGFECDCMPEKGPVDRLIVYLRKYVSSPPISLRRIESYDGETVTYRYDDHRRGPVSESLPGVEFIGRMIANLPPKNFRMVRYYGIYARPARKKIYDKVFRFLKEPARCASRRPAPG